MKIDDCRVQASNSSCCACLSLNDPHVLVLLFLDSTSLTLLMV